MIDNRLMKCYKIINSVEQVICCGLSDMQKELYRKVITSKSTLNALKSEGASSSALGAIMNLKKLCNREWHLLF